MQTKSLLEPIVPMPPISKMRPRMAFTPGKAREEAARLVRHPFWRDFRPRAEAALKNTEERPEVMADAIVRSGLFALVTDDRAAGAAVGQVIERLARFVAAGRWQIKEDLTQGRLLADIAFGYDWAYPFLTPEQRKAGAEALVALANYSRTDREFSFYFEGNATAFNNHTHWNHVGYGAAAFAAVGEHPDAQKMAEFSYDWFTRRFLPVFEKWVGPNGVWNEGTHYNMVAFKPTFIWMSAAGPSLGQDFFQTPWVRAAGRYWMYLTRADDTMTILGDWFADRQPVTITNLHARTFLISARGASAHRDPHLQAFAQRQMRYALQRPAEVWNLLWYDPDLQPRPVAELPPSRLFQGDKTVGGGETLAVLRSGWGPDARLITFSMGDWLGHHDHYDANSFSIHYRDDLAIDPGYGGEKEIDFLYYRRTFAHNSLLVPVPEAQAVKDNPRLKERGWGYDGGQRVPLAQERPRSEAQFFRVRNPEYPDKSLFETGECLHFETRPDLDYVVGDATRAYHRSQLTRWVRHLVFLKPDMLLVYDVAETPAGRQPRWLLQTAHRPETQAGSLVARSGGGELRGLTLLPEKARAVSHPTPATLAFGAGKEGAPLYRTEIISPAGTEHRFLHVFHITDAGAPGRLAARWARQGDWLRVEVEAPRRRTISLRWDGQPGVR